MASLLDRDHLVGNLLDRLAELERRLEELERTALTRVFYVDTTTSPEEAILRIDEMNEYQRVKLVVGSTLITNYRDVDDDFEIYTTGGGTIVLDPDPGGKGVVVKTDDVRIEKGLIVGSITDDPPDGVMGITDGVAVPAAIVGTALIYVDTADGDLKVRFGNGTITLIAAD